MSHALRKITLAAVLSALPAFGCGPGTPDAKLASVQPGAMPAKGDWEGVYYSPLFGTLHLKKKGGGVFGAWMTPMKDIAGRLDGTTDGNVMKFSWESHIIGLVAPNSKKNGKGYFVYTRPAGENIDDEIHGEVGKGEDEVGTKWDGVKQRNVPSDPESIMGAGSSEVGGGDFDKHNSEKGEPEEPSEPSPK